MKICSGIISPLNSLSLRAYYYFIQEKLPGLRKLTHPSQRPAGNKSEVYQAPLSIFTGGLSGPQRGSALCCVSFIRVNHGELTTTLYSIDFFLDSVLQ